MVSSFFAILSLSPWMISFWFFSFLANLSWVLEKSSRSNLFAAWLYSRLVYKVSKLSLLSDFKIFMSCSNCITFFYKSGNYNLAFSPSSFCFSSFSPSDSESFLAALRSSWSPLFFYSSFEISSSFRPRVFRSYALVYYIAFTYLAAYIILLSFSRISAL